jgi:phospholipase C
MRSRSIRTYKLFCGVALCAMTINAIAPIAAAAAAAGENGSNDGKTTTPIKHVIVIIGENRTFDHLFATYVPKHKTDTVLNLLSEGIVNADGTPGPNYSAATQSRAIDSAPDPYLISPPRPATPPIHSRRHLPAAVRRLSRPLQRRIPTSMGCRRAIINI